MLLLHGRAGDAQTLKAAIAASLGGVQLDIKLAAGGDEPPFSLTLDDGTTLFDPNAVGRFLGMCFCV